MYTALVLDSTSQHRLKELLPTIAPPFEYDEVIAHHMTIYMGPCQYPPMLGQPFSMRVTEVGKNEKVLAVKVETECTSKNAVKHITVAVNRSNGGKPVMSNQITDWEPFQGTLILNGTVQECN